MRLPGTCAQGAPRVSSKGQYGPKASEPHQGYRPGTALRGPTSSRRGHRGPRRASIAVQIREDVAGHATLVGVAFLKH